MSSRGAAPYVLRSVAWRIELAYTALAIAIIAHGRLVDAAHWSYESRLRLATALVAASAGLVLDDAAALTAEAAPRHRRVAIVARTLVIVGVAAVGWTACVIAVPGHLPATLLRALCVQAVAWLSAGLLIARCLGSAAVTATLLTTAIAIQFLPSRWAMVSTPDAANWHDAQARWVAVAALVIAALAWSFRDTAAPRGRARWQELRQSDR